MLLYVSFCIGAVEDKMRKNKLEIVIAGLIRDQFKISRQLLAIEKSLETLNIRLNELDKKTTQDGAGDSAKSN